MSKKCEAAAPVMGDGGGEDIIGFIERFQPEVIEKILRHCGLRKEAVPWPPPQEKLQSLLMIMGT